VPFIAVPMGARRADTMTASGMGVSVSYENVILSVREWQLQEGEPHANRR
jgi:hypothetical protein